MLQHNGMVDEDGVMSLPPVAPLSGRAASEADLFAIVYNNFLCPLAGHYTVSPGDVMVVCWFASFKPIVCCVLCVV